MLTLIDNYGNHITLNIYCCAAFDNNRIEFRLDSFIIVVALKRAVFCFSLKKTRNLDFWIKDLHPVTYSMDPPDHWLVVQSFVDEESAEQPANDPERSLLDTAIHF